MNAFERLQALNVALCNDTGAGKGHATTPEAIARYHAELAKRAHAFHAAIAAARADTRRRSFGACPHRYIDGIAAALARATRNHAKEGSI